MLDKQVRGKNSGNILACGMRAYIGPRFSTMRCGERVYMTGFITSPTLVQTARMKSLCALPEGIEAVSRDFTSLKVVGLGAAAIDLLATVKSYPHPDDKIRTQAFTVAGGGNCGNTLTGVRRLGLPCDVITKIGNDSMGSMVTDGLQRDGVNTSKILVVDDMATAFTYVIVDQDGGTRTCIHTPATEEVLPSEINECWLDGAVHLHLDGRHTLAALEMARLAFEKGIPISLDVEKDRPHMRQLLPLVDFIITNSRYPLMFGSDLYEGMHSLLNLGKAQFVISTLGSEGSVLMRRNPQDLGKDRSTLSPLTSERYRADVGVQILKCPANTVSKVIDSTGAGDAFIAGVVYSLVVGLSVHKMLLLASQVAAKKLEKPGARNGLPLRSQLHCDLLS